MLIFVGFALLKLERAVGTPDPSTNRDYSCTIHTKHGRVEEVVKKLGAIEREWCKLRIRGNYRYAIMQGPFVDEITQEEYEAHLAQWHAKVEELTKREAV